MRLDASHDVLSRFLESLKTTDWVITPHARMATLLRGAYVQRVIAGTGISPEFKSWEQFLEQLWQLLSWQQSVPCRLEPLSCAAVWQEKVGAGEWTRDLMEAWSLFYAFDLDWRCLQHETHEGAAFFFEKGTLYEASCASAGWIDPARWGGYVFSQLDVLQARSSFKMGRILWLNFDAPTPLQQKFMRFFEELGLGQSLFLQNEHEAVEVIRSFPNTDQELDFHLEKLFKQDPQYRHALVIPDLKPTYRQVARRADYWRVQKGLARDAVNISSGTPLSHEPLVHTGWLLLKIFLTADPLKRFQTQTLLRSPFIRGALSEGDARAAFEVELYRSQEECARSDFQIPAALKHFKAMWEQSAELAQTLSQVLKTPWQFKEIAQRLWDIWGWPHQTLDSRQYQAKEKFLKTLDFTLHWPLTLELNQAVRWFSQAIEECLFQPESNPHAPFQILGSIESMGLMFESIQVMGLDASIFPSKLTPNPFVPVSLQKSWGWPRSSSQHEFAFAQMVLKGWRQRAHTLTLSFAEQKEGELCLPSPLLGDRQNWILDPGIQAVHIPEPRWILESVLDIQGWPFPAAAKSPFKRGISFLKSQSQCPFQAYVRFRLGAEALPTYQSGLDPRIKGQWRHDCLEKTAALYSFETLQHLSDEELFFQLSDFIQEWRQALKPSELTSGSPLAVDLEIRLILEELWRWWLFEKTRAPFKILSTESEQVVSCEGFDLNLRLDRVDEVEGNRVLIDYKMRAPGVQQGWLQDRLQEPQLPLYATLWDNVLGVVYGAVVDTQIKGLSEVSLYQGMKTVDDFGALMSTWRAQFKVLFSEIEQGLAVVRPFSAVACQQCDLQSVCRIGERGMS